MDRLGIYVFVFLFLGLTFLERVRTKGYSGSFWNVCRRNAGILLFAVFAFGFWGADIVDFGFNNQWFSNAIAVIELQPPFADAPSPQSLSVVMELLMRCLDAASAALIVGAGIWELKFGRWGRPALIAVFCLLIYPFFGWAQSEIGFLGQTGFKDFEGALLVWALPAAFVLGVRLAMPENKLPGLKDHQIKGIKVLPGIKHRFLLSRGLGLTTVFLVLNATVLEGHRWFVSKTIALIPASFTVLFVKFAFLAFLGRNSPERQSCAPRILAIMAAFVATQSCNQYELWQAALASFLTTFAVLIYLRSGPLHIRAWDPVCSLPVFLLGGTIGTLLASLSTATSFIPSIGWNRQLHRIRRRNRGYPHKTLFPEVIIYSRRKPDLPKLSGFVRLNKSP